MTEQDTRRYYDRFSDVYSRERRQGYFGFVNELEVATIAEAVPGKRVLEIGCGTGLILDRVRELEPAMLIGVDLSQGMLADAGRAGHAVACGSVLQLPFPSHAFDVVYSFKVLPHVPDLARALAEAVRVITPDGVLYAELYNPWSIKRIWDRVRGAATQVYLRHDAGRAVRDATPSGYDVECIAGIRIFGPFAGCYEGIPGKLFTGLDRLAAHGVFRYLAGYQVYRIQRKRTQ